MTCIVGYIQHCISAPALLCSLTFGSKSAAKDFRLEFGVEICAKERDELGRKPTSSGLSKSEILTLNEHKGAMLLLPDH